jgi:protein tyrosine phosphatase (PTP) superfamily phosphohydrolase (DUF442 family)
MKSILCFIAAVVGAALLSLSLSACGNQARNAAPAPVPPPPAIAGPAPAPSATAPATAAATPLAFPTFGATAPATLPGLPNVVTYGDGFYCGGVPDGDTGFATLAALGIKTVISVDGAQPDLATAKAHGLRYVHLPIGYNGMDEERTCEIAKAVRDLPGPIYIHCHHGKHRSAAAAAASMVTLGRLTIDQGLALMQVSGTAPVYKGLFACVAVAHPEGARLDAMPANFPESTKTSNLVDTMVAVDGANDRLKASEKAGWKATPTNPDMVPAADAARLADYLRIVAAGPQAQAKPPEFAAWLNQGSQHAIALEDALIANKPPAETSALYKALGQSCADCHGKYRN